MRRRAILVAVLLVLVASALVRLLLFVHRVPEYGRNKLTALLSERFGSTVELADLEVHLFPQITVRGAGLKLRHKGRTDVPPLVEVASFTATAPLSSLVRKPRRISEVRLKGLVVTVPPRPRPDAAHPGATREPQGPDGCEGSPAYIERLAEQRFAPSPVIVGWVDADEARIDILPRDRRKEPKMFLVHRLHLRDLSLDRPTSFDAELTNPVPAGIIRTTGQFGPWQREQPSLTSVGGDYRFENADLATIEGIGGRLSSTGRYGGVLERIEVKGTTTTPDFNLGPRGNAMPLDTSFDACVDGTDGDTYLREVNATLQRTPIVAKGKVAGTPERKGKRIVLDVDVEGGRIEDVLRLAVREKQPFMTGVLDLQTAFVLPPGRQDVMQRLYLNGRFGLRSTRFTSGTVQQKIDELSRRGRGAMTEEPTTAVSDLRGRFTLNRGVITIPAVTFSVSGASVRMNGVYALRSEALDFRGTVRLDARLSQMTTGFKSLLLKAVDPLFSRKNAGTVLSIKLTGTVEQPQFGVDFGRTIRRADR